MRRKTTLSIDGADFFINGRPTYEHRAYNGMRVEGLLLNSRMVQGIRFLVGLPGWPVGHRAQYP